MNNQQSLEDEVDLRLLFLALWKGKWWIAGAVALAASLSVVYALSLPNIYRAELSAVPSEEARGGGLSSLAGQMGGLAALAGVNIGGPQADKASIAIETLKSRKFIGDFISRHELKVPLMAATGWNLSTNELIINPDIYNTHSQQWTRPAKAPKAPEPSLLETTQVFLRNHLSVQQEQQTGMLRISVDHYSPSLAAEWTKLLLRDLNEYMKEKEQVEAEESIKYLEAQLETTRMAAMQDVFSRLIEQQYQVVMLANVREEYMFSTVDPAIIPEEKAKPSRALIAIAGTLFGGIVGVLIALTRFFWRNTTGITNSSSTS